MHATPPAPARDPLFRWLFLEDSALAPTEYPAWKISALRIILVSGFALEALIAFHSSWAAVAVGAYHIVGIVALFYCLLATGIYCSLRKPRLGAGILIGTIYAAGVAIMLFVNVHEVAKLGVIFVYTTPLVARIFFGVRPALLCMTVNTLPFLLLLRNEPLPTVPEFDMTLAASHTYIQSLLFLFFNVCIPLAVLRVLHALDATAGHYRRTSDALGRSRAQYEEIFENSGSAILLCTADGHILQANGTANRMIGRPPVPQEGADTLGHWLRPLSSEAPHPERLAEACANAQVFHTHDDKRIAFKHVARTTTDHYIVALRDVSDLHRMQSALESSRAHASFLRTHDQLTGLPNRQSLRQHLAERLPLVAPERLLALAAIRLNSVRYANETCGVGIGDDFIRRFAERLADALPPECFCARLRSVVFALVIDRAQHPAAVVQALEQAQRALPTEIEIDGQPLLVQLSIGVALARPDEPSADDLIRRCEIALDTARRSNDPATLVLFDERDAAEVRRSLQLEIGMREALRQHELHLVYQPQVTLDGSLAGMEALLRWRSATLGEVSPAEFIPVAERAGLINDLTAFVIDAVCAQVRQWLDTVGRCPPVAINLSAHDIVRDNLVALVLAACARHAVDAGQLEFEITETGLIENETLAIRHLEELKARGFGIAIDDFGTGYSSLAKLSRFPARCIKIDRSFVNRIGHCEKSETIIRGIVSLAGILGCTTVAEGVETAEEEAFLKSAGCPLFQGYRYHRPLPPAEAGALLARAAALRGPANAAPVSGQAAGARG